VPAATAALPVLLVEPTKAVFAPGEAASLRIRTRAPSYVYCYARDSSGTFQRVFPNRFAPDPRVEPAQPLTLPGQQGWRLEAGVSVACLAAPRDVYQDVPAALRWGDFQALNAVHGVDDLQRIFEAVAKAPIAVATITVPGGARP
jgi:hypothetical protein